MSVGKEETLPLEKRKLHHSKNGVGQIIPALHKEWTEPREWVTYQVPPMGKDLSVIGAKDAWMERTSFVLDDLEFLLGLPYHRFWSQMTYDSGAQVSLGRILRLLPRPYDIFNLISDIDVRSILNDIHRKTFFVFLRLSTHKESEANFMSTTTFAKLVYDNFLFDIPKMIDLAILFHDANSALVEKMLDNVFRCQPSYESDLVKSVNSMVETMNKSVEKMDSITRVTDCDNEKTVETVIDLIIYTTDIAMSIHQLMKAFPRAATMMRTVVDHQLATFYQTGLILMQTYIKNQSEVGFLRSEISSFLNSRIFSARHCLLLAFRSIVANCFVNPAMEEGHNANLGEEFLHCLSSVVGEFDFFQNYSKLYPIEDDLDIFNQAGIEVDALRLNFIQQGLKPSENGHEQKAVPVVTGPSKSVAIEASRPVAKVENKLSGVEMESLVSQVRDLLPDLGDGFVHLCLEYFDNAPEKVINALLEENLPPHLAELDRKMQRKKSESPKPVDQQIPVEQFSDRINVFDGDEFDVNSRAAIDKSKVHRGKKKFGAKNANALLDDKKDLSGLRDRFSALSMVSDVVYDVDYDDEYDDTYDDNAMGEREPDASDEVLDRRPFVVPRVLAGPGQNGHANVSDDDEEEEEAVENEARRRFDFARNPEDVRAEAEQRRQSKMGARGGHRPQPHNRDVVGRAKGQGQDASVLRNRAKKTENKGKHHRHMADKKMSRGMF